MTSVLAKPPVVMDNGSGYTKLGFAGNFEPNYIMPTFIQQAAEKPGMVSKNPVADLDFYIGDQTAEKRLNYNVTSPIMHGLISDWDAIEKYWQRSIYSYLSCDPEEHYFLLTEPPLNTPENREQTAEIFFETFSVPGLYIAVQAVLALCASLLCKQNKGGRASVTGTVIDSGDGATHVIPVYEGYVIGSCIKHIPLAGRDITNFIVQQLRDRNEPIPPDDILTVAKRIKESFCYVAPDIVSEFRKYDREPSKYFKSYTGVESKTKTPYTVDVGYERFLGPELFFHPEIFSTEFSVPLPLVVDSTIQACPIDTRRALYSYITLSGGSTMFKHFQTRLQRDIRVICNERYEETKKKYPKAETKKVESKVVEHPYQRFAVWFGGSMLASTPEFLQYFITKQKYQEEGPRCARASAAMPNV